MIRYKVDILPALKAHGFSSYRLRQEKLIGQRVITQLRNHELVSWAVMDSLCRMLDCQPGDLVEFISDDSGESGAAPHI